MDSETAGRVNAVVRDVMSAFRSSVELVWHAPELIEAAGFESFEAWARAQPKPQLPSREERRELAFEYRDLGLTQRETAAVLGVGPATVNRDLDVPSGTSEHDHHDQDGPEAVPNGTDEPADAPPARKERRSRTEKRVTVRDARTSIKAVQLTLADLTPLDVVPAARPVIRAFAMELIEWIGQWSVDDAAGVEVGPQEDPDAHVHSGADFPGEDHRP